MRLYSIVTGILQDPVLPKVWFKVDSLQLKVKPGNRASPPTQQDGGQAQQDGRQRRGRSPRHGGQGTEEAPKARRRQGRFWGVAPRTPRVELLTSVYWVSWSLRSECLPTTNSRRKALGHPAGDLAKSATLPVPSLGH